MRNKGNRGSSRLSAVWGNGKIGLAIATVVAALAFAPAAFASGSSCYGSGSSLTITQNTSMIVNVSGTSSGSTTGTVSLSDVSLSDSAYVY
jgi:hypothetical protein